jgi:hypothetical protein
MRTHRVVVLTAVLLAGLVLAIGLFCEFGIVSLGDGSYTLSVRVHSASESPIRSVTCEAFGRAEGADYSLKNLIPPDSGYQSATADPFTGEDLTVEIRTTVVTSGLLDRVLKDSQSHALLVIVQYGDGRRVGKVFEIPHRRVASSIEAVFP